MHLPWFSETWNGSLWQASSFYHDVCFKDYILSSRHIGDDDVKASINKELVSEEYRSQKPCQKKQGLFRYIKGACSLWSSANFHTPTKRKKDCALLRMQGCDSRWEKLHPCRRCNNCSLGKKPSSTTNILLLQQKNLRTKKT